MQPAEVVDVVTDTGVIGIVRTDSFDRAIDLSRRLWSCGIRAVEVALTTPDGVKAIETLAADMPEGAILGAGTVLDAQTARLAVHAGAQLLVTPTVVDGVVGVAQRYGAASIIGSSTPTEMLRAQTSGTDLVKVFPASSWTPGSLKDVLQALPQLRCVPTGGIKPADAADWINAGAVAVGLGSALTKGADPAAQTAQLLAGIRSAR